MGDPRARKGRRLAGWGGGAKSHTGRRAKWVGIVNAHGDDGVGNSPRRWPQAPSRQWKDVSIFITMSFELDRRTVGSVANFAGMDKMSIAYKEAGGREGRSANRWEDRRIFVFGRVPGNICSVRE